MTVTVLTVRYQVRPECTDEAVAAAGELAGALAAARPAGRAFQQRLAGWVVGEPPVPQPLELAGAYGLGG